VYPHVDSEADELTRLQRVLRDAAQATRAAGAPLFAEHERDLSSETFQVWLDNGGSVRAAADVLFCHSNTVPYRLRRIEQRTDRSLSCPRDLAELCLVLEVFRRLM
jgi:DNA-binding PucR family transcriptional regulator